MKKFEIEKTALNNYLTENNFKQVRNTVETFYGWYISHNSVLRVIEKDSITYMCKESTFEEAGSIMPVGYLTLNFCPYGTFPIHRAVALAHVPGYKPGYCANHIDGNKLNNDPSNLEWVTYSENMKHAWKNGLIKVNHKEAAKYNFTEHYLIVAGDRKNPIAMDPNEYVEWRKEHGLAINTFIRKKVKEYNATLKNK